MRKPPPWGTTTIYDRISTFCADCYSSVEREFYMVHNDLWESSGIPRRDLLCIGCLEARIGRRLTPGDFPDCPVNRDFDWVGRMSERLQDRLGGREFMIQSARRFMAGHAYALAQEA